MIKLGCFDVSLYPNTGIVFENRGTISFEGRCSIGNNSAISTGDTGKLVFGDNFCSTASLKIACYKEIVFGENVLCGWNCIFMDTDFHEISSLYNTPQCSIKEILIGDNCWFALNNTVMKGTILPSNSIIASNSLLNKDYSQEGKYCLFAGQPAIVKKRGITLVR
jgi:acetyltransferase-like isoleucine patch superfamily enzyme